MAKYIPDTYSPLIHDLKVGLEHALFENNISVSGPDWSKPDYHSRDDLNPESFIGVNEDLVWLDKLAVAAIREIDEFTTLPTESGELPIVYSWYRYGRATPMGAIKPNNLNPGRLDLIHDGSPSESSFEQDYPSPEDFSIFFDNKINEIGAFESDLYEYLTEDYSAAPDLFRDVYLPNLETQQMLYNMYNIERGPILDDDYVSNFVHDNHRKAIQNLESNIYRSDFISEDAANQVQKYLDSLRDLILGMESFGNLTLHAQVRLVRDFVTEYHGSVWLWVSRLASSASIDESKPGSDELESDNNEFVNENQEYWSQQIQQLDNSLESAELSPSLLDYQHELSDLERSVLSPIEDSFQVGQ